MCDEKEGSGRQIPVNKYATAHLPKGRECSSQMSQAALSDGQSLGEGGLLLGGGGTFAWGGVVWAPQRKVRVGAQTRGGNPRFPTPLYETLTGGVYRP